MDPVSVEKRKEWEINLFRAIEEGKAHLRGRRLDFVDKVRREALEEAAKLVSLAKIQHDVGVCQIHNGEYICTCGALFEMAANIRGLAETVSEVKH